MILNEYIYIYIYYLYCLFSIFYIIGFDFVDLLSFPSSFSKLRFDILLDYAVAPHQFSDFCKTVYPSGGILADEMGLG